MHRLPFCFAVTMAVAVERPSLHDVELELDGAGSGHDGAGEHRGDRTHRLLGEPLGDRDDRLGQHLRALDHLPLVLTGRAGLCDEAILPVLRDVEEVEQRLNRPRLR